MSKMTNNKTLKSNNPISIAGDYDYDYSKIAIYGASGSGKSRLAARLANKYWEKDTDRVILIVDTEKRARYAIAKELSLAQAGKKVIVSDIGEEHSILDFWEGLKMIVKECNPCCVIIDSMSYIGSLHSEDISNHDPDIKDYFKAVNQAKFRDFNGMRKCEKVTFDFLKNLSCHVILCGTATSEYKQAGVNDLINLVSTNQMSEVNIIDCKKAISEMDFVYYLKNYNYCIVRKDSMNDLQKGEYTHLKNFSIDDISYLYDGTLSNYLSFSPPITDEAMTLCNEIEQAESVDTLLQIHNDFINANHTAADKLYIKGKLTARKNILGIK